jgi:hypothetical protein
MGSTSFASVRGAGAGTVGDLAGGGEKAGVAGVGALAVRDVRDAGWGRRVKGEAPACGGGVGAETGVETGAGAGAGVVVSGSCNLRPTPNTEVTLSGTMTVFCPCRRVRRAGSNEARTVCKGRLTKDLSWVALS